MDSPQPPSFIYNPTATPDDAVSAILQIHAHHATNIHNICIYDNQDVYAKFSLTSDPDHTISTRIIHGGGKNPLFNEDLVMEINQLDAAILKCEIWMMSRAKNYMDDQLLGFALIPISSCVSGKGKVTQDFDLSSTDLFHSPAGTIKLSLFLNSNTDTADSDSSTTSVFVVDKNIPEDYSRIEFPDINQQIVSEVFAKNEAILRLWMDKPDASFLQLGSTPPTVQDYDMAASDESSSMVENSGILDDHNSGDSIDKEKQQQPNVLGKAEEEKTLAVGLVVEESAMQRQIVDMYMRSMQQFTESLAKMKLPMDLDKPGGDLIIPDDDEIEKKKNKKDRVFYGSRAFF